MFLRNPSARFAFVALLVAASITSSAATAQVQIDEVHAFTRLTHHSALIQATDGNFYGIERGEIDGITGVIYPGQEGFVYRLTPDGTFTVLHTFRGADGAHPLSALVQASDGMLYGTTQLGGPAKRGTIYRMTLNGVFTLLYAFRGKEDGQYPHLGELTQGSDGNFYGAAGASDETCGLGVGCGSVLFRMTPSGNLTTLHTFRWSCDSLKNALVEARDGNFYGTGWCGGSLGAGMIFRMTRDGIVNVLYNFTGGADGFLPRGLFEASDGNLYGTTELGGNRFEWAGKGTVFRLTPSGSFSVIHTFLSVEEGGFTSSESGSWPEGSLIQGTDGRLYGTTMFGGGGGHPGHWSGTVYRMSLDGSEFTVLHTFPGDRDSHGWGPEVALTQASDGRMYGVATNGYSGGIVFRLPAEPSAQMTIDVPRANETVTQPFVMTGWALDDRAQFDTGIDTLHVWALPLSGGDPIFVGASGYGSRRPDVASILGDQFLRSGFGITVRGLAPGTYRFVATPHSSAWNEFDFDAARTVTVTISSSSAARPQLVIDTPGAGGTVVGPRMVVAGWALDLGTAIGTGVDAVQIYAYPDKDLAKPGIFLGAASYGGTRPDVASGLGPRFTNVGYELTANAPPPGEYKVVVFARSSTTGVYFSASSDIAVRSLGNPAMWIDAPLDGSTQSLPFLLTGWAIDRDAQSGTGVNTVHVWAFSGSGEGRFLGAADYGGARSDIGMAFGARFANSSYALSLGPGSLSPGTYQIVVFASSTVTGSFNQSLVTTVTVR